MREQSGVQATRHRREKRLRKHTPGKARQPDEDSYRDAQDSDADEEVMQTPTSSQHPSEDEADEDDQFIIGSKKVKSKMGKKSGARNVQKKPKVDAVDVAFNFVKSRNRLVGDIQNNDLYGDDDDLQADQMVSM